MKRTISVFAVMTVWILGCDQVSDQADFRFISSSAHHYLDPQKASWSHDIRVIECMFEPLVRVGWDGTGIEGGVAEKWSVSSDGLTYTFSLRSDARWSNGEPVVAKDFVYAWRRGMLPDSAADYTQLFFCIDGAKAFFSRRNQQLIQYVSESDSEHNQERAKRLWEETERDFSQTVGVSAVGDRELVVRLAQPTAYFLELCAFVTFMPVHRVSVEEHVRINVRTGMRNEDPNWTKPGHLICNGPYVLKDWRFKRGLVLSMNPNYWNRAQMGNGSISERIVVNPQTALLAYENGEVDWLPDIPTSKPIAADLIRSGRKDVHAVLAAGTYFYNFNCNPVLNDGRANPLVDSRVRRALSMVINRQIIVDKVTRLGQVQPVAHSFVPDGAIRGYRSPVESGVGFDPKAAGELLAQAGYRVGTENEGGRELTGLSILYNTEGGHEAIAQQIKRSWQTHLGVVVKLEGVEGKVFGERLKQQDYTICRAGWFGDYRDPTTFLDKFLTGNGNNDCAWSDSKFDEIMRDAGEEQGMEKRMGLLRNAEERMLLLQPIAPIYHYVNMWIYDADRVQGLQINPWRVRRLDRVRVNR